MLQFFGRYPVWCFQVSSLRVFRATGLRVKAINRGGLEVRC